MTTSEADALLWGRRPVPGRGRKPSLSVERIVTEAIALADAEGLRGVSMPRLAERLGRGVMTLYRYVPGKDELVALMTDAAVGAPPASHSGDWRRDCRAWALALRRVCLDHPWWVDVMMAERTSGPNETAWLEAELAALEPLRLDPVTAMNVALAISGYVRGAVQPELPTRPGPRFAFLDFPETHHRYPRVSAVIGSPGFQSGEGMRDFFAFGLERLLDGVATMTATESDGRDTGTRT